MFIKLRVHADAREEKLVKKAADSYEIWVKAPAERGLANRAVLNLLARELGCAPGKLHLVKGAQSPSKIVKITEPSRNS